MNWSFNVAIIEPYVPEVHTFNDWRSMGFRVNKGEKHVARNADGVCLFSEDQVTYTGVRETYVPTPNILRPRAIVQHVQLPDWLTGRDSETVSTSVPLPPIPHDDDYDDYDNDTPWFDRRPTPRRTLPNNRPADSRPEDKSGKKKSKPQPKPEIDHSGLGEGRNVQI